jgi:ferric-dicitrate binding protein FerR (iron transport regulator)
MDLTIIIPIGLLLFALLLFVIIHNRKKQPFIEDDSNDSPTPRIEERAVRLEDGSQVYRAVKK